MTLLPTPAVNDMGAAYTPETRDAWTDRMKAAHGNGNGHGKPLAIEAQRLLPTPVADNSRGLPSAGTDYASLANVAATLLPTPTSRDHKGHNQRGDDTCLTGALLPTPRAAEGMHANLRPHATDTSRLEDAVAVHLIPANGSDHASEHPARTGEELRDVRDAAGAEALQRSPGGPGCVPETSPLLPELCEHQNARHEGRAPLEGAAASVASLLRVRDARAAARSSQGPEPREQLTGQPRHPLCFLPPAPALARGPRCPHGCGSTCGGHSPVEWGAYEAAIRRWEVLVGRGAPTPTEPGPKGSPRLSARFVEFLMGLPAGHVTDPAIGISRNDQLKALGNGVVPQQSAAATRAFLSDFARMEQTA